LTNMQSQNRKPPGSEAAPGGRFSRGKRKMKKRTVLLIVLVAVVIIAAYGVLLWRGGAEGGSIESMPTYRVARGNLTVTVTAGGTVQARESFDVKSEMEGQAQILSIIPEGTVITEEDLKEGLELVKLDSSGLEEKEAQQNITFQNARAAYASAKESYSIQEQQNESNIASARLNVKFAKMELERYLGAELAARAIEGDVDFADLGNEKGLGGQALQSKRDREAALSLAREELSRAEETLRWTKILVEKGYVNKNQQVADELQEKRRSIEVDKAEAELRLFLRYTLPKEAEQRYADFQESNRELKRVVARAKSELAQKEADLKSKEATFNLQKERLEKVRKMIANSTIKATKPGLVVYASTIDPGRYRNNPIQEGVNVREGQTIISIPDLSTLAARVEIHETQIRNVKKGQEALITVEAMPGRNWRGKVARISPMAKSEHRWLNPNVMVYDADISLEGEPHDLKPGMSATVEIVVARIPGALSVPIEAVITHEGRRACWVAGPSGQQLREVETGYFTETHVEIKKGLKEGEEVYLAPPETPPAEIKLVELPGKKVVPEAKAAPKAPQVVPEPAEETGAASDGESPERRRGGPQGRMSLDPAQFVERIRQMEPERRKQVLERMEKRLESLPPEERRKWEKQLAPLLEESAGAEEQKE